MPPFAPKTTKPATAPKRAAMVPKQKRPREEEENEEEVEEKDMDEVEADQGNADDIMDGEFSEMESDAADEPESKSDSKAKKRKPNGSDSKYRAPSNEEMIQLKEATDLFQSNLFKLSIDELLKEASIDYTKTGNLDKALHGIKAVLDGCSDLEDMTLDQAVVSLAKKDVVIPFPEQVDPSIQYKFSFKKPEKVFIAGSYLVKTITKGKNGFNVDVAVQMPDSIFTEKDHINNRYFNKRAYYLAVIAAALKSKPNFANIHFQHLNKDPRRPILVIESHTLEKSEGGFNHLGGPGGVQIRILPVVNPDFFATHKLAPGRNSNRPQTTDSASSSSAVAAAALPATPRYNTSLLMDTTLVSHLNLLHKQAAACPAFRDAVILGKVWLNQRGLSESGFSGFIWSLVIVYLLGQGNRVNQSTSVSLKDSFSSYQIVKLTIDFLANHNFADEPLFMTPDGKPIDHPDFSAKSFTQQFDCVIVDPTGKVNVAAFVNASTLSHLQFEAKASLRLFNDLGSEKFDSLFLKNLTEPMGYFDLILRVNDVPESFAAYKPSVQLDFPSKRQFFAHFVPRLLRLGIKTRTHLIKLTDSAPLNTTWTLNETKPLENDFETIALYVGLILDPEAAIQVVEQGPTSGETEQDANAVENFRRLWGTRSSLRRFNDGSLVESVVWESDGTLEDRVLITGRMAAYLIGRHVNVEEEDMKLFGGQFLNVLREFGGGEEGKEQAIAERRVGTFQDAIDAFNAFSKAVKALDGIPLDINAVIAADPGLRHSSIFIPQPSYAGEGTNRLTPILRDQMDVVIEFESSGKWPNSVPALQHMKLAFYCKIAELIASQIPGSLATVSKPDISDLTTGWLNVRMPSGYSFRARIRTGVELALANAALISATSTGVPHLKSSALARASQTEKVYKTIGTHTHRFQNVHFRYPHLSSTVRLVKRWISAHWLSLHFSEEAIEILVTSVFVNGGGAYASPPACAFSGLVRVLELFWKWDWEREALIVEFEKGDVSAEQRTVIQAKVGESGSKKGGLMRLATADDLEGVAWTLNGPSALVLKRVKVLAKASYKLLKDAVISGDDSEIAKIFVTPTDGYDYIVELDVTKVPRYHQSITYDPEMLPRHKSKFKNLAALEKSPLQRFLESFNPVDNLIHDIEHAFGDTMTVFYDMNGGDKIGLLVNKKLVVPQQLWKVNIPYTVKPQDDLELDDTASKAAAADKKNKAKKAKVLVVPDYASMGAEIARMGMGLIVSISSAFE
ncbi:hypothetical protein HDU78_007803 [Chytriomyces hyalinus]|nr:hypothetical protein HDU78_007803 [Chytriomyces hyalinus]